MPVASAREYGGYEMGWWTIRACAAARLLHPPELLRTHPLSEHRGFGLCVAAGPTGLTPDTGDAVVGAPR